MSRPVTPMLQRFWSKVDTSGECWVWLAHKDKDGYGTINKPGAPRRSMRAHRYSFLLFYGPFDERLMVCHRCDNPSCVRPDHLFLGDNGANMRDRSAKGRDPRRSQTHCKNGHAWDEQNTYWRKDNGSRQCRSCTIERQKRRRMQLALA